MDTPTDNLEEFISLPGSPMGPEDIHPAPLRTFQGKALFPYDVGIEGVMREALIGIRGDELYALTFLRILTDLQCDYEKFRSVGWNGGNALAMREDDAAVNAIANILRGIQDDAPLFQAKAINWRKTLKRKGVAEAIVLVNDIAQEGKEADTLS
jgi:hypothetical protein